MQKLTPPSRAGDQVLPAFEACCGTLRSLEVARVRAASDEDDERLIHIARAIKLLGQTIAELRSLLEGGSSALGAGFVLASGNAGSVGEL